MQERQVTIGDETFPLPQPFGSCHENPIDQEGTILTQMDRFMLKLIVDLQTGKAKILEASASVS